ncbi:hypothetical protein N2152v2_000889 [Parachlorella kessleri]
MPRHVPRLKIAILGAGIWAQNTFLPILRDRLPELAGIIAVYSRSEGSASALLSKVHEFSPEAEAYHGDEGLADLLARPDVDAVLVALAAQGMLEVTKRALAAGKHVLSEKPAGPTLIAAKEMLHWVDLLPDPPLWCVEENFRSEPAFLSAQQLLPKLGSLVKLDLVFDLPMTPDNKYYGSGWRRDAEGLPGGFMLEASVHFMAALRDLVRAAGWGEAVTASATVTHTKEDLPTPDTLVGMVRFEKGAAASVSISFAGAVPQRSIAAVGTEGTLEVRIGRWHHADKSAYEIISQLADQDGPSSEAVPIAGVERALDSFLRLVAARVEGEMSHSAGAGAAGGSSTAAEAAAGGGEDSGAGGIGAVGDSSASHAGDSLAQHAHRVSAVEASRDLALIEALLKSGQLEGRLVEVQQVASHGEVL